MSTINSKQNDIDVAPSQPSLRDEVLWGAQAIAEEINRDVPITYYLLAKGLDPSEQGGHDLGDDPQQVARPFRG